MNEHFTVTGRDYEDVQNLYRMPRTYFESGGLWLSVGEGLSDWAVRMRKDFGTTVISVDPIYKLGNKILQKDPKKVESALDKAYKGSLTVYNAKDPCTATILYEAIETDRHYPLSESDWLVAGDGFKLPFEDKTFDFIVSAFLIQHSNYEMLLPEMLRVLKDHGEIRNFGFRFNVLTDSKIVLASSRFWVQRINSSESELGWSLVPGIPPNFNLSKVKGFRKLRSYLVLTSNPKHKVLDVRPDLKIAELVIHRKDDKLPTVTPYREVLTVKSHSRFRYLDARVWDNEKGKFYHPYAYKLSSY